MSRHPAKAPQASAQSAPSVGPAFARRGRPPPIQGPAGTNLGKGWRVQPKSGFQLERKADLTNKHRDSICKACGFDPSSLWISPTKASGFQTKMLLWYDPGNFPTLSHGKMQGSSDLWIPVHPGRPTLQTTSGPSCPGMRRKSSALFQTGGTFSVKVGSQQLQFLISFCFKPRDSDAPTPTKIQTFQVHLKTTRKKANPHPKHPPSPSPSAQLGAPDRSSTWVFSWGASKGMERMKPQTAAPSKPTAMAEDGAPSAS